MFRPRCRSTSAHASPHSRVKERLFEAVRMGPVERATSRARTRKRTRVASDMSIKASGRRISRFSPHLAPLTVALPPDPDAHRHVFFLTLAGGGVFKNAALQVLRKERRLMSTGEVTR